MQSFILALAREVPSTQSPHNALPLLPLPGLYTLQPFRQARSNLLLLRPILRPLLHPTASQHHRGNHLERRRFPCFWAFLRSDTQVFEKRKIDGIAVSMSVRCILSSRIGEDQERGGTHTKPQTSHTA